MRFLHFSDIHFHREVAGHRLELDAHLRNEILRDVERMAESLGPVDSILVSGDIAFGGKEPEFSFAEAWLKKVCERTDCSLESIFMCPGNHDVDRDIASEDLVRSVRHKI